MFFIGQANDIHKLVKKNSSKIIIGGYEFDSTYEIIANSDGDILIHAICDAIFGACQESDLGSHFPESLNANADSKKFLKYAIELMKKKNYELINIDATIICEQIMFSPIRNKIIKSLIELLECKKINIKFTRWEDKNNYFIQANVVLMLKDKEGE